MRSAAITSASRSAWGKPSNADRHSIAESSSAATLPARTRSKRAVYSSTAASPRARTSARIALTVASTAASSLVSNAVNRFSAASKPAADESSRLGAFSSIGLLRRGSGDRFEQRLHAVALELERGRVDDEPCTDRQDLLDGDQIVGLEGVAGADQVDDGIGQTHQRRELHRSVEPDQIDVHALAGEVLARSRNVLSRNPEPRATLHRTRIVEAARCGNDQGAAADAKIDRLIQALAPVLEQHVLARHAEIGGAVFDVGRHVGGTHDDEAHIGAV